MTSFGGLFIGRDIVAQGACNRSESIVFHLGTCRDMTLCLVIRRRYRGPRGRASRLLVLNAKEEDTTLGNYNDRQIMDFEGFQEFPRNFQNYFLSSSADLRK